MPRVEAATPNVDAMLLVLLPRNLVAAATRHAVAVQIEFAAGPASPFPDTLRPLWRWRGRRKGNVNLPITIQ